MFENGIQLITIQQIVFSLALARDFYLQNNKGLKKEGEIEYK